MVRPQLVDFARTEGLPESIVPKLEALFESLPPAIPSTLGESVQPTSPPSPAPEATGVRQERHPDATAGSARYQDLGPIGAGGMGEVRRVWDRELQRTLAMKVLPAPLRGNATARARFLLEARTGAKLQHPNLVPVHDMGVLPDGRPWFTMQEVRGQPLSTVIEQVHGASPDPATWSVRRLLTAFAAIARAVAHAHSEGVLHRDLKPSNIVVGDTGEIYVVDWGLTKHVDLEDVAEGASGEDPGPPSTHGLTRSGSVLGTPAWMAPEQAQGEEVGPHTDIYGLGALLYTLLSGRPPYTGATAREVVDHVKQGPPPPLDLDPMHAELGQCCQDAMARDPALRTRSAELLAERVEAWLDGARRREQALEVVQESLSHVEEAERLVVTAADLRKRSEDELATIPKWAPESDKAAAWALADEAGALDRQANLLQLQVDRGLQGALRIAPDLVEARSALISRSRARHAAAELLRDGDAAAREAVLLEEQAKGFPAQHPLAVATVRYLEGRGALTLVTDPPGAEVLLHRYTPRPRRLVPELVRSLGRTPLREVPLPMGSYLCVLRREGHVDVSYPVEITRLDHWDGVAPGGSDPHPIWLPRQGEVPPEANYVPAGRFRIGGDPRSPLAFSAARPWCRGFLMHRMPVTQLEYIAFLDDLVDRGREAEALLHAPKLRPRLLDAAPEPIYERDAQGYFTIPAAADPDDQLLVDHPIVLVDWRDARAWLAWRSERAGTPWRLPTELEWEKAARGVDGRTFPFGDHFDPSWARIRDSERFTLATVHEHPLDESPYGIRGLAGNTSDWCLNEETMQLEDVLEPQVGDPEGDALRPLRGGFWTGVDRSCFVTHRKFVQSHQLNWDIGFRGVVPLPQRGGSDG